MNPILADIYSTVIPSAPFVIAAYALLWLVLFLYVAFAMKRLSKAEKQINLLEQAVE